MSNHPLPFARDGRSIKAGDWWVITGMDVILSYALRDRPAGTSKLLVCADTINLRGTPSNATEAWRSPYALRLDDWSDVIVFSRSFKRHNGCNFRREKAVLDESLEEFRFGLFGQTFEDFSPPGSHRWEIELPGDLGETLRVEGNVTYMEMVIELWRNRGVLRGGIRTPSLPNSVLEHLLVTAHFFIDEKRTDDANFLISSLETLLGLGPGRGAGEPSWQELAPHVAATREVIQRLLPGSDRVPYLSPAVYGGVVGAYGPALKAFADTFQQFDNRTADIVQRKRAANLILDKQADVIEFQALVTTQLTDNFKGATDNVSRAQTSIESQSGRVDEAEKAFTRGLAAWRTAQERQAAMAIAGAVFSFVGGVAKMFTGNPAGAVDVAAAAEAAAKAATTVQKLVELMKKLAKLVALIAKIVKMCKEIVAAAGSISNAREFAGRMANVVREAESGGLDDAPSASAYWDQLWVEVETALAPAVDEGVAGAAVYLKELKVMVIYGRALTSAQAAIPPIAQEMARASLLAEIAKRQHEAVAAEVATLQAGQPASAMVRMALWLRHRSVQRAMFTALHDFDAAHRYWALTAERPQRDPIRSFKDFAGDLLDVADIKASEQRALESFDPNPQDFKGSFEVPATAVADLLRDGSFTLHFTPNFSPVAGWGNVGRVRVHEAAVWVIWNDDKRPKSVEFTVRTDGEYYDQRVESDEVKEFRFIGPRVNRTFRYDPVKADRSRKDSIIVRARVADDFRAQYSEPTLFTGWEFSLPKVKGIIDREALAALQGAVKGLELEFSGNYIKDADRFS
jgi:hypothetical protein